LHIVVLAQTQYFIFIQTQNPLHPFNLGIDLKCIRDIYRVKLKKNPRYEHPPVTLKREWKAFIEDTNEKRLRKEGRNPLGPGR
jgi:hypothetical protein